VNIFLSSALFDRGAVRLFLFTGQLSKDQVDIKKESFCHGFARLPAGRQGLSPNIKRRGHNTDKR